MKLKCLCLAMAIALGAIWDIHAQGTAFTYEGRLNDGANPANGSYDLRFALFDSASSRTQQGNTITSTATAVNNGLFTVTLDFGPQFSGAARWLEIGVRTNGGGGFTMLSPRQALLPTPYAIHAASAGSVAGSNILGSISQAQLPANVAMRAGGNNFTGDQVITSGNVGIGAADPATRLTVATPTSSYGIEHTDGSRRLSTYLSGNAAWFGTVSPDPFHFFVNDGGPALTIAANEHVGVGTVSPGENSLQIGLPFHLSAGGINGFGLAVNQAINGVGIQINRGANQGGFGLLVDNSGPGDGTTSLLLLRNKVASGLKTVMDVQADGKVGIQSSAPGKALQVGDASVTGSSESEPRTLPQNSTSMARCRPRVSAATGRR